MSPVINANVRGKRKQRDKSDEAVPSNTEATTLFQRTDSLDSKRLLLPERQNAILDVDKSNTAFSRPRKAL